MKRSPVVSSARIFATQAHVMQRRKYTGEQYLSHLDEVALMLKDYTDDDDTLAVAYLHDTVEDTEVTFDQLRDQFGYRITLGVWYLTDVPKAIGTRETRKWLDRERIATAPQWVQLVKLADMISNTSTIAQYDCAFARIYLAEKRLMLDEALTKVSPSRLWAQASGICNESIANLA